MHILTVRIQILGTRLSSVMGKMGTPEDGTSKFYEPLAAGAAGHQQIISSRSSICRSSELRSQTTVQLERMEPFDRMERREVDVHSSWEKLSTSATPEPPLQAVSAGELSVNEEEDDEALPLLSRKIAAKRQGRN